VGQEMLFQEIDLSDSPARSPYLLLRTLLETPGLRPRVHKLTFSMKTFALGLIPGQAHENVNPVPNELRELLPFLQNVIRGLAMDPAKQHKWMASLHAQEPQSWLCVLFCLLPRLRYLCFKLSGSEPSRKFFTLLAELQESANYFQTVKTLELRAFAEVDRPQADKGRGPTFPNLETLAFSKEGPQRLPVQWEHLYCELSSFHLGCSKLRNLELTGLFSPTDNCRQLREFPTLRSLTYHMQHWDTTIFDDYRLRLPIGSYDSQNIPLEHVKIDVDTGIPRPWWPEELHCYPELKTLEVRGSINLSRRRLWSPGMTRVEWEMIAACFFAPNVEHVLLAPSDAWDYVIQGTPDMSKIMCTAFENFFENIDSKRPHLRTVKLGGWLRQVAEHLIKVRAGVASQVVVIAV
jgi:hypothetical protein